MSSKECSYVWNQYAQYPAKLLGMDVAKTVKLHDVLSKLPIGKGPVLMAESISFLDVLNE